MARLNLFENIGFSEVLTQWGVDKSADEEVIAKGNDDRTRQLQEGFSALQAHSKS